MWFQACAIIVPICLDGTESNDKLPSALSEHGVTVPSANMQQQRCCCEYPEEERIRNKMQRKSPDRGSTKAVTLCLRQTLRFWWQHKSALKFSRSCPCIPHPTSQITSLAWSFAHMLYPVRDPPWSRPKVILVLISHFFQIRCISSVISIAVLI